jgi:tyrosine-protein kinase Etk/Wzc
MAIHDYFQIKKGPGLSDVLAGRVPFEESVAAIRTEKLHYLQGGTVPPNPGELILGGRLQDMLGSFRQMYQRVIIDSPPVLATDDTLSLCPYVDGVLFVVKAGHTSMRYARNSMAALHQRGARIFGVILNYIDTRSAHYYYNYYYSGYYYGSQKPA